MCIRPAQTDEQGMLESLQRRASLSNPGDRDVLLANPDAIALPIEQIAEGCVFVAEREGTVVGFAAVIQRLDGVLHVIGNPHAEGFYMSCGFRVTGTVETQFGIGLAMSKAL
jgi:hypothetical protein